MSVFLSKVVFPKHVGGLINDILLPEIYSVGALTKWTLNWKQDVPEATCKGKGKGIPLQAWTGPEGSRWLRLPDFKTIGT